MYDHGPKKHSSGKRDAKTSSTGEAERRNADRHTFTASAEVIELGSGARFSTRTTDLGPGGCFVDTLVPFPVGAEVQVTLRKGDAQLETGGFVVYSQEGLGMGIAFDTLEPHQHESLNKWLSELTGVRQPASFPVRPARGNQRPTEHRGAGSSPAVVRLVRLMIGKGLLTESEGASVLHDPLL